MYLLTTLAFIHFQYLHFWQKNNQHANSQSVCFCLKSTFDKEFCSHDYDQNCMKKFLIRIRTWTCEIYMASKTFIALRRGKKNCLNGFCLILGLFVNYVLQKRSLGRSINGVTGNFDHWPSFHRICGNLLSNSFNCDVIYGKCLLKASNFSSLIEIPVRYIIFGQIILTFKDWIKYAQ